MDKAVNKILVHKGNLKDISKIMQLAMNDKETQILCYGIHEENAVMYDSDGFNLLYTTIHGITPYYVPSRGGTIVVQKGDFSFFCVSKRGYKKGLVQRWMEYLSRHCVVKIDYVDNDYVVKSADKVYKICGTNSYSLADGRSVDVLHLSLTVNLSAIKNTCIKKMVKEPKGLLDFDSEMTSSKVLKLWEEFLNKEGIL